jgi:hypothetical protein
MCPCLSGEYEMRLRELEGERQVVEEDRAQVGVGVLYPNGRTL